MLVPQYPHTAETPSSLSSVYLCSLAVDRKYVLLALTKRKLALKVLTVGYPPSCEIYCEKKFSAVCDVCLCVWMFVSDET